MFKRELKVCEVFVELEVFSSGFQSGNKEKPEVVDVAEQPGA